MKNSSKILTLLCAGLFCLSLAGCGDSFSKEDAATLVEGDINSVYMNTNSADYLELCNTTEAERTEVYETSMESEADSFVTYYEFDETMLDDATYDRIIQLYKNIYSHTKFEVGDVAESEDSYLVSVTIYPIDIFVNVMTNDYDAFYATYEDKYNDSSVGAEELEAYWQNGIISLFEARLNSIGYLDPTTLSVQVVPEESDDTIYYSISTTDATNIYNTIISYDF